MVRNLGNTLLLLALLFLVLGIIGIFSGIPFVQDEAQRLIPLVFPFAFVGLLALGASETGFAP